MQLVFVRGVGGEMRRLALLEVAPPIAYVCFEHEYEATVAGTRARPVIGYRLEDIFEAPDDMDRDTMRWNDDAARRLRPIVYDQTAR